MATVQQIDNAVASALANDSGAGGVATLVSSRIYSNVAPDQNPMPEVVIHKIDESVLPTYGDVALGITAQEQSYQIDVWGLWEKGEAVLRTIAERIFTVLHGQSLTVTGWSKLECNCIKRGGSPTVDDDALRISTEFKCSAS